MRLYCDFDGTVTKGDTTDLVLRALASPSWERLERAWERGEVSASDCMHRQIGLIQGSDDDLDAILETVEIDPSFSRFVGWCETHELPLTIVSDGVDRFIGHVLRRHALGHLPVVSNRLIGNPKRRQLSQPNMRPGCAAGSGVCKCAVVSQQSPGTIVFIGDGRSDFCVSSRADILFAKNSLAEYAKGRGKTFYPFGSFDDVTCTLARLISTGPSVRALSV